MDLKHRHLGSISLKIEVVYGWMCFQSCSDSSFFFVFVGRLGGDEDLDLKSNLDLDSYLWR